MSDDFADTDISVTSRAYDVAELLDHDHIGTDHLLVALSRLGEGAAWTALDSAEIPFEDLLIGTIHNGGRGRHQSPMSLAYTDAMKATLDLAQVIATRDQMPTDTGHLLRAVVGVEGAAAATVLAHTVRDMDRVMTAITMARPKLSGKGKDKDRDNLRAAVPAIAEVLALLNCRGRRALSHAATAASVLGHDAVDSGHILLGLLSDAVASPSLAGIYLEWSGVGVEQLLEAVEINGGSGADARAAVAAASAVEPSTASPRPTLSPAAEQVMSVAYQESIGARPYIMGKYQRFIGTEHLLLAVADHPSSALAPAFTELGFVGGRHARRVLGNPSDTHLLLRYYLDAHHPTAVGAGHSEVQRQSGGTDDE
jgi:ATP-dependent Clp protease ATP-binding subunit ClpA